MKPLQIHKRLLIIMLFTVLMIGILIWEYYNGGIKTHYILQNDTMPAFSNWWGLVVIPVYSWFASSLLRVNTSETNYTQNKKICGRIVTTFILGGLISYSFVVDPSSNLPLYITAGMVVISPFLPIYTTDYFMGYVLGTLFLFGAIIPIIAGSLLWIIFYAFYKVPRYFTQFITKD